MNTFKGILSTLFSVSILLCTSCVMTKTYTKEEKKMVLDNKIAFVEKNDGQKITGNKISFPSGFSKKSWVSLDGQKFQPNEIKAFQTKSLYRVKFGHDKDWVWVTQLKRGKINLFYYEVLEHGSYYNGTKYVSENKSTQHFVFQKGDDKLLELGLASVSDLLKDNKAAFAKFNAQFKPGKVLFPKQMQNHPKVLFDVIDIYNAN